MELTNKHRKVKVKGWTGDLEARLRPRFDSTVLSPDHRPYGKNAYLTNVIDGETYLDQLIDNSRYASVQVETVKD